MKTYFGRDDVSQGEQIVLDDIGEIWEAFHFNEREEKRVGNASCVEGVLLIDGERVQVQEKNSFAPIPIMPEEVFGHL